MQSLKEARCPVEYFMPLFSHEVLPQQRFHTSSLWLRVILVSIPSNAALQMVHFKNVFYLEWLSTYYLRVELYYRYISYDIVLLGTWTAYSEDELGQVVSRLTKPTASYVARREASLQRREFVDKFKAMELAKDIGWKGRNDVNVRSSTSTPAGNSRQSPSTPTAHNRASPSIAEDTPREERCVTSGWRGYNLKFVICQRRTLTLRNLFCELIIFISETLTSKYTH